MKLILLMFGTFWIGFLALEVACAIAKARIGIQANIVFGLACVCIAYYVAG